MLEKEFLPYKQALELKGLGFDEPCFGYHINESKELILTSEKDINYLTGTSSKTFILAPTFSQAFRWFREKRGLYSWITMELGNKSTFCWVLSGEHTRTQYAAYFHTYEEAELACLKKLIEIVKTK